jgi:hypothetical protein
VATAEDVKRKEADSDLRLQKEINMNKLKIDRKVLTEILALDYKAELNEMKSEQFYEHFREAVSLRNIGSDKLARYFNQSRWALGIIPSLGKDIEERLADK